MKLSRFCKQFQSHESSLPWTPPYVHFSSFTLPSRLFIPLFNFCFWCMLDKSFNETTLPSSDNICFWSSFLFALTSWKLLPSALWVMYFAEDGVDLTTKQDKVFFNRKHCTRLPKCSCENKTNCLLRRSIIFSCKKTSWVQIRMNQCFPIFFWLAPPFLTNKFLSPPYHA